MHALGLAGDGGSLVIQAVDLLGSSQKVEWRRTTDALNLKLPQDADCKYGFALRVKLAPFQHTHAQEIQK